MSAAGSAAAASQREQVLRLGPWHLDVEIEPGLSTRVSLEAPPDAYAGFGTISFLNPRERFRQLLLRLFPDGLAGRRVLDCGCNCGGYLFWARELGAGECLGIDVREHWIEQARFLARARGESSEGIRFEVCDVYDLPALDLEPFDVTLFNGLFYHLPDPITALKGAADLTTGVLMLNTATRGDYDDGALVAGSESSSHAMSGVYGLNWFPSGPRVLTGIAQWMGFESVACNRWRRSTGRGAKRGRIEMLAARERDFFAARPPLAPAPLREAIERTVPQGAVALVASGGDERMLQLERRWALHLPRDRDGSHAPLDGDRELLELLDREWDQGADYVVVPSGQRPWLERHPALLEHLTRRCEIVWEGDACLITRLSPPPTAALAGDRGVLAHDTERSTRAAVRSLQGADELTVTAPRPLLRPAAAAPLPSIEVSPRDLMYSTDPDFYYEAGWWALRAIKLAMLSTRKDTVSSILDLPCGHGRVLRTLQAAFPQAALTACDIDREAVDFCAGALGATPAYSSEDPGEIEIDGEFDLIWCGSLLTHLDRHRWQGFLALFDSLLAPGGLLLFSVHGPPVAALVESGSTLGLGEPEAADLLRSYEREGFAYADYPGSTGFGLSLSSPAWVCSQLERNPRMRLSGYAQQAWLDHDVVTCLRPVTE